MRTAALFRFSAAIVRPGIAAALVAASMAAHALVPLANIAKIAAGASHACALTTGGGVKCWGLNSAGQLGDNSTTQRFTPVGVSGLAGGVAAISAGDSHACALTTLGGVKCWGSNSNGQLGDGSFTNRSVPADVMGLANGVAAISAGPQHTCALTTGGGVLCWGYNFYGQLGNGSTSLSNVPVAVASLASGVAGIAASYNHTCALTTGGGVKCWGYNAGGQLGDGQASGTQSLAPVDVAGLASGVAAIAAGDSFTCALTTGGGIKCWGSNNAGQLGDNSTTDRFAPVDVVGLASGVAAIATGDRHACALTAGGGAKCWGYNGAGQLGDDSSTDRLTPVDVLGLASGIAAIAAGQFHTCALTTGGGVKCWGFDGNGQLGDNFLMNRPTPADAVGLTSGMAAIATSFNHTCAITTGGGAKCWGLNSFGQVGDNSTTSRAIAVDVSGLASDVAAIATGNLHTCAVMPGGVKCWGSNGNGQLGNNSTTQSLVPLDASSLAGGASAVATGYSHTCALTPAGGVKCWGYNASGQLGNNSITQSLVAIDVTGLAGGVSAIAAGYAHSCALTTGGGVKCWGSNIYGQLGDNSGTPRLVPVDVFGLTSGVAAIAAGQFHTCALTAGGGVKCWGNNGDGRLGDNSTTQRLAPVDVFGLASGVAAIAAGSSHTCALVAGGAKCWGYNGNGQLGDGSTTQRLTAVDVIGLASGVSAIAAGSSHTCALMSGGVKCWGNNLFNQLGDATGGILPYPADVLTDGAPPLALVAVQSRKTHGASGAFDIAIDAAQPIAGAITVEPRAIGAGHTIVFQFNTEITATGTAASVDAGAIAAGTASPAFSGNDVIVTLNGIPDNQRVTVSLTNVNGAGVDASASIGFLVGDVNTSRSVTATDIVAVKARSGQLASAGNFRFDVNVSGSITATDILAIKGRSGLAIP